MSFPMTRTGLVSQAYTLIRTKLSAHGFIRDKFGISTIRLAPDVIGWIGLNKGFESGMLYVNPVVGVRNQSVERIVAEINEEEFNLISPPTLAANIGYLGEGKTFVRFRFGEDRDENESEAERLLSVIVADGIPFMKANSDLDALVGSMQHCAYATRHITDYRIPVALAILGRYDEMVCFAMERVKEIQSRSAVDAKRYDRFVKLLCERAPSANSRSGTQGR